MAIAELFDKCAHQYDSARQQLIPCFDEFYGTAISVVEALTHKDVIDILDVGAGTGLFSRFLAVCKPEAKFHLLDVSSSMLALAKSSAVFEDREVQISHLDMRTIKESKQRYDVVISSLAIHHLDAAEKQNLFQTICSSLKSSGVFVNADQALGPTAKIEELYRQQWLSAVKEKGVSQEVLQAALERMQEDKMDTLANQLLWLDQAGFEDVHCWYQNYSFCVYSGVKR